MTTTPRQTAATAGPVITSRAVWAIAGPMILSNLSIAALGAVDTGVAGHLGSATPLAAAAIGSQLVAYLAWGAGFLRMSTTGLAAAASGRGDLAEEAAVLWRGLAAGLIAAIVLSALAAGFLGPLIRVFGPPPAVAGLAGEYILIRLAGLPAALAVLVLVGWFVGRGDARLPLAMILATNIVNAGLDVVLALWLGMGLAGVALASAIAEWTGCLIGLAAAVRHLARHHRLRPDLARLTDWPALARFARVNGDIFARTLLLIGSFALFMSLAGRLGTTTLAATALLLTFLTIASYGLDGMAYAAESLAGRALGAGDMAGFDRAVRVTGLWTLGLGLVAALAFAIGGPWLIRALTDLAPVRALALSLLPYAVALPLVAWACFWLDGVFIGATWSAAMRDAMLLAFAIHLGPALLLPDIMGADGVWIAFLGLFAARGLAMAGWYVIRRRRLGSALSATAPAPATATAR